MERTIHLWKMLNRQWYRIQHHKILVEKASSMVGLSFNHAQHRLVEMIDEQREAGVPVRIIILKARRLGFSTICQNFILDESLFVPNTISMTLSFESASAEWLCDMARRAYDFYNEDLKPILPERTKNSTLHGMEYANGSREKIATAKNLDVGRSTGNRILHISEVGMFRKAEGPMLSLLQTVEYHQNTVIFLESTAKGTGNYFHKTWERAVAGDNEYKPLFVGWNEHPDYFIPFINEEEKESFLDNLTDTEHVLMNDFNVMPEQLKWRRWCIPNQCHDDEYEFKQEYPITAEEAFLTSGTPRFNVILLDRRHKEIISREVIDPKPSYTVDPETGETSEARRGQLFIYEAEQEGEEYVIGIDPSEGKAVNKNDGKERDDCVIQVLKRAHIAEQGDAAGKMKQSAVWRSNHHEQVDVAKIAAHLGYKYNNALINVEENFGKLVLYILVNRLNYPHVVHKLDTSQGGTLSLNQYGFYTSSSTRKQVVDLLAQLIEYDGIELNDPVTVKQCQTFVRDLKGKVCAENGCKDDDVLALCMAVFCDYVHDKFKTKDDSVKEIDKFKQMMAYMDRNFSSVTQTKSASLPELTVPLVWVTR